MMIALIACCVAAAVLAFAACATAAPTDILTAPAQVFDLTAGYYDNRRVWYYNFNPGLNSADPANPSLVNVADIHVLVTGFNQQGAPIFVAGQGNIIDVLPGDSGYSDLWNVLLWQVPANYKANNITSYAQITAGLSSGYVSQTTPLNKLVNCPVVPRNSTLANWPADQGAPAPLVHGWYKGKVVDYFDFGGSQNGAQNSRSLVPIGLLYKAASVPASPDMSQVAGPNQNLVNVIPQVFTGGSGAYSAFWAVKFYAAGTGYQLSTVTSLDDAATQFGTPKDGPIVNCPIVQVDPPGQSIINVGNSFRPSVYNIDVGETLTFRLSPEHSAFATTAKDGCTASNDYNSGPPGTFNGFFNHTFTTAGTYWGACIQHCNLGMTYTVHVGSGSTPGSTPATTTAPPSNAQPVVITATPANKFSPDSVEAAVGQTVRWTNLAAGFHTVDQLNSLSCSDEASGGFSSGAPGGVDTFEHVFTQPGTYFYKCKPHCGSGMLGTVIVKAASGPVPTPNSPTPNVPVPTAASSTNLVQFAGWLAFFA